MQTPPCVTTFLQSWLLVLAIKPHLHQQGRLGKMRSTRAYAVSKPCSLKSPYWKGLSPLSAHGRPLNLGLGSVAPTRHLGPCGKKLLIDRFYLGEI